MFSMLICILSSKRELQCIYNIAQVCVILFLKVIHGNSEYTLRNSIYACTLDTFFFIFLFKNGKYKLDDKENRAARSILT